jgi:hypothetical protein
MAYGILKCDNITFDNGGSDQNVTVSGLYRATTSGVTVTGTISGAVLVGTTTVSGATVTGNVVQGTTVQGVSGTFTSLTGTTTTGTTANFASGVFTTRVSGTIITGDTGQFTSGTFVSLTGTTITGTTINAVTVSSTTGTFTSLTGTTITGTTINGVTVSATTGSFTSLTGTTTSGTTANFVSGVFTTQVSGTTVTGTTSNFTSGNFATLSGATATFTSGVIALGTAANPSLSFVGDPNTGIYSPGADRVAVATNGVGRLFVDASGRVGIGVTSPAATLHITGFNTVGGIKVVDSNLALSAPGIEVIGKRSDSNVSSAFGGKLLLSKNRTDAAINSTNVLGSVAFGGNHTDGTEANILYSASIVGAADGAFNSATDMPTALVFNTGATGRAPDTANVNTGTERLRITSAGLVGIGTSAPGQALTVARSGLSDQNLSFDVSGTGNGIISSSDSSSLKDLTISNTSTSKNIIIKTTNSSAVLGARVVVNGEGNVGIGTTSPGSALEINAAAATSPFIAKINTSEAARIDSSGRLLVGTSTSFSAPVFPGSWTTQYALPLQIAGTSVAGSGALLASFSSNKFVGAHLGFCKSTSGTVGSIGTVVANDAILGTLSFSGDDGSKLVSAAAISAVVDGTPGTDDMPGRLVFSTTADGAASPTERMRITNDGRTDAFGTSETLRVRTAATTAAASIAIRLQAGATSITAGGTTELQVTSNGNVQNTNNSYGAISDIKLKENIADANSQWSDIKALQVRNYNFKEGQTHTQIGLVAQEVELVSPGLVTESPDRDADGNDLGTVTKSVNYSVLYMKAVKALQEAIAKIESLEARLTAAGI